MISIKALLWTVGIASVIAVMYVASKLLLPILLAGACFFGLRKLFSLKD